MESQQIINNVSLKLFMSNEVMISAESVQLSPNRAMKSWELNVAHRLLSTMGLITFLQVTSGAMVSTTMMRTS